MLFFLIITIRCTGKDRSISYFLKVYTVILFGLFRSFSYALIEMNESTLRGIPMPYYYANETIF